MWAVASRCWLQRWQVVGSRYWLTSPESFRRGNHDRPSRGTVALRGKPDKSNVSAPSTPEDGEIADPHAGLVGHLVNSGAPELPAKDSRNAQILSAVSRSSSTSHYEPAD